MIRRCIHYALWISPALIPTLSPSLAVADEAESPPRQVLQLQPELPIATLPNVALSVSVLQKLLTAEIALQRQQPELAVERYLKLARETKDPRLARRAVSITQSFNVPSTYRLDATSLYVQLLPNYAEPLIFRAEALLAHDRGQEASEYLAQFFALAQPALHGKPLSDELGERLRIAGQRLDEGGDVFLAAARPLLSMSNPQQAMQLWMQLIKQDRDRPQAKFVTALLAQSNGDALEALRLLAEVQAAHPEWNRVPYYALNTLQAVNQHSQQNSQKNSQSNAASNAAIQAQAQQILPAVLAQTRDIVQRYVQQMPTASDVQLKLVAIHLQMGQRDAARQVLQTVLAQPTTKSLSMGELYDAVLLGIQTQDRTLALQALQIYRHAVNDVADGVDIAEQAMYQRGVSLAYFYLADLAEQAQQPAEALQLLNEVTSAARNPTASGSTQSNASTLTLRLAAWARQVALLQQMNSVNSQTGIKSARQLVTDKLKYTDLIPSEQLQLVLMYAGLRSETTPINERMSLLTWLAQYADTYADEPDFWYSVAMSAEHARQFERAEDALRRTLVLRPNDAHAWNALGYMWVEQNIRLPEADEALTKAIQLAPNDPMIRDSVGWLRYRQGRLQDAKQELQQAFSAQPDREIGEHLIQVLRELGETAAAQSIQQQLNQP
jgi:Flp pilus assembly protein TadD